MQSETALPRPYQLVVSDVGIRGIPQGIREVREHNRSHIGHARGHGQQRALAERIQGNFARHVGTRTDHAHATGEYVQKLWQLVELRSADHSSNGRDPRISGHCGVHGTRASTRHHGADLEAAERTAAQAYTLGDVEWIAKVI